MRMMAVFMVALVALVVVPNMAAAGENEGTLLASALERAETFGAEQLGGGVARAFVRTDVDGRCLAGGWWCAGGVYGV